jgi:hypothetical protein
MYVDFLHVYIKVPGGVGAESFREALRRQINLRTICVGFFVALWHFYFRKDKSDSKAFMYSWRPIFRGVSYHTDLDFKDTERLSVSKQAISAKFDVKRCDLKKLNEVDEKKRVSHWKINIFSASENRDVNLTIIVGWKHSR